MKYSVAILAFAAGVLALPQESSITSAPAASASLSPTISCIQNCDPADVTCQAACQGIARPNSSQAAETNECAAKCDQGDGSAEDTQAYAKCQQDCFASLFPSTQTNFQGAGGAPASAASSAVASATSAVNSALASASSAVSSAVASGELTRDQRDRYFTLIAVTGASSIRSGAQSATSSGGSQASSSESAPETTSTPGAASANSAKIAGAGLAGLLAIFAL